jgi:hypothetical protein
VRWRKEVRGVVWRGTMDVVKQKAKRKKQQATVKATATAKN